MIKSWLLKIVIGIKISMLFYNINMVRAATIMFLSGKCLIILHASMCCHIKDVYSTI